MDILYDTQSNYAQYPVWQEYSKSTSRLRCSYGARATAFFTVKGAKLYERDLKNIESHFFDTGHFALEEEVDQIASLMRNFLGRHLATRN